MFLDDDDELHPHALEKMAAAIADSPEADVLYSDEDKLSPSGERYVPTLKPDWSPDLLLEQRLPLPPARRPALARRASSAACARSSTGARTTT